MAEANILVAPENSKLERRSSAECWTTKTNDLIGDVSATPCSLSLDSSYHGDSSGGVSPVIISSTTKTNDLIGDVSAIPRSLSLDSSYHGDSSGRVSPGIISSTTKTNDLIGDVSAIPHSLSLDSSYPGDSSGGVSPGIISSTTKTNDLIGDVSAIPHSLSLDSSYHGDSSGGVSPVIISTPKIKEKVIPNYLRASSGSCHDVCKYGRRLRELKPWHSLPKRIGTPPIDVFISNKSPVSSSKKVELSSKGSETGKHTSGIVRTRSNTSTDDRFMAQPKVVSMKSAPSDASDASDVFISNKSPVSSSKKVELSSKGSETGKHTSGIVRTRSNTSTDDRFMAQPKVVSMKSAPSDASDASDVFISNKSPVSSSKKVELSSKGSETGKHMSGIVRTRSNTSSDDRFTAQAKVVSMKSSPSDASEGKLVKSRRNSVIKDNETPEAYKHSLKNVMGHSNSFPSSVCQTGKLVPTTKEQNSSQKAASTKPKNEGTSSRTLRVIKKVTARKLSDSNVKLKRVASLPETTSPGYLSDPLSSHAAHEPKDVEESKDKGAAAADDEAHDQIDRTKQKGKGIALIFNRTTKKKNVMGHSNNLKLLPSSVCRTGKLVPATKEQNCRQNAASTKPKNEGMSSRTLCVIKKVTTRKLGDSNVKLKRVADDAAYEADNDKGAAADDDEAHEQIGSTKQKGKRIALIFNRNTKKKNENDIMKGKQPMRLRKGIPGLSKERDSSLTKMKFQRGTTIELQSVNHGPRKLKFRRGKIQPVNQEDKADVSKPLKKKVIVNKVKMIPKSRKVVLRHRDMADKKDAQGLLNIVIEETASKLVKSRKSKVKALVGAFETVISLQDSKPSSNVDN